MNRIAKTKANPENYYPSEKRKIRPSRNIHAVPRKIRLSCFFPSSVLSNGTDNCSICLLYYLVRGKRPDFLPRGTASCSCHVCVSPLHRQTDVFVSQINWPCSPPINESKGAEVQKQVLCSSEDAQWNNKGQAGYLQKKLLMDMCRLLSSSAAGWHPCV